MCLSGPRPFACDMALQYLVGFDKWIDIDWCRYLYSECIVVSPRSIWIDSVRQTPNLVTLAKHNGLLAIHEDIDADTI